MIRSDDLIGRIEEKEKVINVKTWKELENVPNETWVKVNFEALKESEPSEIDPREKGQALWENRHSRKRLEALRELDPVKFQCLHQGNPASSEGRLYRPFKTWTDKKDWGTFVRSGCYIDVADEGNDYLFAVCYDIYKSDNKIYNEQKRRFEPLLFALVTDIDYTNASTDITTITTPNMINRNGTQFVWVESNNGGSQFEKTLRRKVQALTKPFFQTGNKESRVLTASAEVNQHIIFPFGWEDRFKQVYEHVTTFLRDFGANAHDDIEDGLTGVFEKEIADGNDRPYNHQTRGVFVRN